MQIESLKLFCDLAETTSFTKAAKINGVTQSAVSQQISSLETKFDAVLIERSKKKFSLTKEGNTLYKYSKQIIQTYDELRHKIQEIQNVVTGSIKVVTIYSIGLHELPPYLKKFLKKHPTVNVSVEYRRATQLYEDIVTGMADIGLVAYPQKDPRLQVTSLAEDMLVLICHPDHPLAQQPKVKLSEIASHKFIAFEPDIPTRRAIDKILRDRNVEVDHAMEFDNIETVKRAVEIDAGISIVPRSPVAQEVAKKTIAMVEIEDEQFYRPLAAVHKKSKVLSPAMKEFLALLKKSSAFFRFFGFSGCRSFGRNIPSLRMRSPSNHTSPPPHSLRWISTMSQCTAERLPLSHSSYACPGVKCSEPPIFSSNKISHIGFITNGFTPNENSPIYRAPASVSRISFSRFVLLLVASITLPSFNVNLTFSNFVPAYSVGVLN